MTSRHRNPQRFQRLINGLTPHIVKFRQEMATATATVADEEEESPPQPPQPLVARHQHHRHYHSNRPIVWSSHVVTANNQPWLKPAHVAQLRRLLAEARYRLERHAGGEGRVADEIDALLLAQPIG